MDSACFPAVPFLVSDEISGLGNVMVEHRITSLKSTPIKVRPVSQEHSCASVDDYVKMDVKEYLSQGVSLDELLKTVFNFDNDSYENFKTWANSWLTTSQGQTTFADLSAAYREKLEQGVQEPALYTPFSNMGQFILTNAMTASSTPQKRRVKLAFTYNKLLEGKKPDFCIVPEKSDFSSSAKADQSTGEPVTRCYVNSATNNAAVASVASTTSGASSSTFAEDSATLNNSGGTNVGTSNPQTAGEDNGGSSSAIKDEEWKFVLAPLEIKMFRSNDARKLSRKKSAEQPPTKRAKTDNSKDVSSPKTASASATSEEPLIRLDDVFSEQAQSATSLQEDTGKQTKSTGVTDDLVQFANYAIKVLSCRGDRSFALVPVVTEQFISVTYYSREGFAESQKVDFLENPVMLAAVLGLFVEFSSDLPRLGFNKKMGYLDPFEPDSTTTLRSNMQFTAITKAGGGNDQDGQPDLNQLQLGEHITTQVGAIGRGTSVYRLENTRFSMKLVAKHSYQVNGRRYEHDIIRAARRVDPVHVPEIFGYAIEGSDQILKTLRDACPFKSAKYEEREFRVLVMREYTTISELGINEEFLHAMAQIMTCKSRTLFLWRCCTHMTFRYTRLEQEEYPPSRYIHIQHHVLPRRMWQSRCCVDRL